MIYETKTELPESPPAETDIPEPTDPQAPVLPDGPLNVPPQKLLNTFLDHMKIDPQKLPEDMKKKFDLLMEGKNGEGDELPPEEYYRATEEFARTLVGSKGVADPKASTKQFSEIQSAITSGNITRDTIGSTVQDYMEKSGGQYSGDDIAEVMGAMKGIGEEVDLPEESQDKPKLKEKAKKIVGILKIVGMMIVALFGLTVFRAFKSRDEK